MMDYDKVIGNIVAAADKAPWDVGVQKDFVAVCADWRKHSPEAHDQLLDIGRLFRKGQSEAMVKYADEPDKVVKCYEGYERSLRADAPYDFDSFLLYMEKNRKAEKRFYQPRRRYLRDIVRGYQKVADGKIRFLSISLPKRAGKACGAELPVLTTEGWKKHGELDVGDYVYGPHGNAVKVLQKHPDCDITHVVKFSSGQEVPTSAEHEWCVFDKKHLADFLVETQEMLNTGLLTMQDRARYYVANHKPFDMPNKSLPVDPYTLGAWLIGGKQESPVISINKLDYQIVDSMLGASVEFSDHLKKKCYLNIGKLNMRAIWRDLYMGRTDDHLDKRSIPEMYFTASITQRLELLAGLVDMRSSMGGKTKEVILKTTSKKLAYSIRDFVATFGWTVYVNLDTSYSEEANHKPYLIKFIPTLQIPCRIPRKFDICKKCIVDVDMNMSVVEIRELDEPVVGNCITVEGGLYCVGNYQVVTHNSQLGINFTLFLSGKEPNRATLMEGAGDALVKSFYKGTLEYLLEGNEYTFNEIFPDAPLVATNADIKTVNLHTESRFPTVMCRSIDATQVGLSEATNLLYLDDCVEGREEAKNRPRLDSKWEVISGDVMGRAIEGTPLVATGTRYSIYDPIGRLQEEAVKQGWAWEAFEIPALDLQTDESNYEYQRDGKPVFTSAYFKEQRELLSEEQFESEFQQRPFEAKGVLFPKSNLNYYFELPVDKAPDAVFAVCDTAERGSDSVSMPVGFIFGQDVYIHDLVFNNGVPEVTKPLCAKVLMKNNVASAVFESNNAGDYFARDVGDIIGATGYRINIRTKRTISNKQTRIELASDGILKNFYFKHPSTVDRKSEYFAFMQELTTYTRTGKNPHDDAPDSLSLMENEIRKILTAEVRIFERRF